MAVCSFNIISLCAGVGGLDLGLRIAVPNARTVCFVEREAFACANLVAQMEGGALDHAPVWSDLFTFDGRPWRGVVDCLIAGLPCQPYSVAGKRLGHDDERALWPEFIRIIEECQPAVVFLENVAAFVQYFKPVGDRLSALGYRIEAGIFSASEVGAPHRRERFFALAYRADSRRGDAGQYFGGSSLSSARPEQRGGRLADPLCERRQQVAGSSPSDESSDEGRTSEHDHEPSSQSAGMADAQDTDRRAGIEGFEGFGRRGFRSNRAELEDSASIQLRQKPPTRAERRIDSGEGLGDSDLARLEGRSVSECERAREFPAWPPGPQGDWSAIPAYLAPALDKPSRWRQSNEPESDDGANGRQGRPSQTITRATGDGRDFDHEFQEESQPIVCRMVNGVADRAHNDLNYRYEESDNQKESATSNQCEEVRGMRDYEGQVGAASQRLQPTAVSQGSVLEVSPQSGSGIGLREEGSTSPMRGLRSDVSARAQQARNALWFVRMRGNLRAYLGEQAMGRQEQIEELRRLWEPVSVQEAARPDMLAFMREQACLDETELAERAMENRMDRLRACGNGVVPLQAAYAFTTLARLISGTDIPPKL